MLLNKTLGKQCFRVSIFPHYLLREIPRDAAWALEMSCEEGTVISMRFCMPMDVIVCGARDRAPLFNTWFCKVAYPRIEGYE